MRKGSTIIVRNKHYSSILINDYLKQFYLKFFTRYFTYTVHSSLRNIPFVTKSILRTSIYSIHYYNTILLLLFLMKKNFNLKKREKKRKVFSRGSNILSSSCTISLLFDRQYIYIYSVSNNRVLVCIRGFIIAWLRSIEIPRSARYSKRRQKLSPIRARWFNLPKFQVKFQYRITYRYKLRNECQIYLKNLRGLTSLFFLSIHFTFRTAVKRYVLYIYHRSRNGRAHLRFFLTFGNCRFSEEKPLSERIYTPPNFSTTIE